MSELKKGKGTDVISWKSKGVYNSKLNHLVLCSFIT